MVGFRMLLGRSVGRTAGLALAAAAALISPPIASQTPPDHIFGNYAGAGKCATGAPPSCRATGTMDNLYIGRVQKKTETEDQKRLRESFQMPEPISADARIAVRILREHGHSCTFESDMLWAGDHLKAKFVPVPARTVPNNCQLELWFNGSTVTMKDPGNRCSQYYCSVDRVTRLAGRRFVQGADRLLAAYQKSSTPPPATIFGEYRGTGKCATDERKTALCNENEASDYIVVRSSGSGSVAQVTLARARGADQKEHYFCLKDVRAIWLGDHLAVITERQNYPGVPHLVQFWFKNDTAVVRNIGDVECGTYVQGSYFKKSASDESR